MKIIDTIKQFSEVAELREENFELYKEKKSLAIELEETKKQHEDYKNTTRKNIAILKTIKDIINENPNGSVTSLQNRIRTLLEEAKI